MKKLLCVVPLVILFFFTIACQDKAAMAELEKYKAQAKVEEQNIELVRSFLVNSVIQTPRYSTSYMPRTPDTTIRRESPRPFPAMTR